MWHGGFGRRLRYGEVTHLGYRAVASLGERTRGLTGRGNDVPTLLFAQRRSVHSFPSSCMPFDGLPAWVVSQKGPLCSSSVALLGGFLPRWSTRLRSSGLLGNTCRLAAKIIRRTALRLCWDVSSVLRTGFHVRVHIGDASHPPASNRELSGMRIRSHGKRFRGMP